MICIEDEIRLKFLPVFYLIHQHMLDGVFDDEFPWFVYQ
jgi:hypothetical protein